MTESDKLSLAIKEMEILNLAIARQEEIGLKIRGWCIALYSAITIAYLSEDIIRLKPLNYLMVAIVSIILFFVVEITHRIVEERAIRRSRGVEEIISSNAIANYRGPVISKSLTTNVKSDLKKVLKNLRIYLTYLAMIILTIITYFFVQNPT